MIFTLPEPLPVSTPVLRQVEAITTLSRLDYINPSACKAAGLEEAGQYLGLSLKQMATVSGTDYQRTTENLLERMEQFIAQGYSLEGLDSFWKPDGELRHFKTSYHGFIENDCLTAVALVHRDQNSVLVQEQLVAQLAQELSAVAGKAFFDRLVERLASVLGFDFCAVGELIPGTDNSMKLLACYESNGNLTLDIDQMYDLQDKPGFELMKGESLIYFKDVQNQFPDNQYLKDLDAYSYLAVPVLGDNKQPLGNIVLMHSKEVANVELAGSLISIFAIRCSAEIERSRAQQKAESRDRQRRIFIENSSSGMFVVDIDPPMPLQLPIRQQVQWLADNSNFSECNKSLVQIFGLDSKQLLLGRKLYGDSVKYDYASLAREFVSRDYSLNDRLFEIVNVQGHKLWVSVNLSSVTNDEHLTQMLGVITDASERIGQSRQLEHRARHDGLTGLPNRGYLIEQVEQVLSFSVPSSKHALFILDLDGFKEVNDTLGHETGDKLLIEIGPRLESVLSEVDAIFARLGGDEFAVFIQNFQSEQEVTALAGRLMEAIKQPFAINGLELVVGGSIGIAYYPENAESISALMRCADVAMYQAKRQSRDYSLYSSDRDHYTVRRLSLMMDVRQSITNDDLRLYYQPIVALADERLLGFEALIRWQHPELGMLSPGEFIPLIELTDMIMPVTWWVVETAIKQLREWCQQGWNYRLSVNVSTRNLADVRFVSFIEQCLLKHQVAGRLLEIEITESTLMADPEKARHVLQDLAALGVRVSIDDYGTGYSSLAYLKSLPINTLKIDRTFISQMLLNPQDKIIVQSTIQLAHNLGLEVTAEGIEDASLIADLNRLGCEKGQGFYFCKPIPVEELKVWLSLHERRALQGASKS